MRNLLLAASALALVAGVGAAQAGDISTQFNQSNSADNLSVGAIINPTSTTNTDLGVTSESIGNLGQLTSSDGNVDLPDAAQTNSGSQYAVTIVAPFNGAYGTNNTTLSAKAFGNAMSITAGNDITLDAGSGAPNSASGAQNNTGSEVALLGAGNLSSTGSLGAAAVAVGNSASFTAASSIDFSQNTPYGTVDGGFTQNNSGAQVAAAVIGDSNFNAGNSEIGASAAGNSLSFAATGGNSTLGTINQSNTGAGELAVAVSFNNSLNTSSLTSTALGNTVSATEGGDLHGAFLQSNSAPTVALSVSVGDTFSGVTQVAATSIGNALSITH